ncbi:MAG: DNA mismatch repair endonuclease MutL [Parcubacteria group bacterium]
MNKINILPQELINQIAAGEVVERPASIVKELVENSIDAGAKNIAVEIENGGLNLVKVSDDGCGMSREDALLSVAEHATSKIQNQEDLFQIKTLGFRGEALSAIASVSEFTLITKDKDSLAGTILQNKDNQFIASDIGGAEGTSIEVKNLFYNIPARRKYSKTPVTEFNHIIDLFLNYCLAYPRISWKFVNNKKMLYQFPAVDSDERVFDVLGDEVSRHLIRVDLKMNDILITGHVGKPQIARNNRKLQYLFVNRRPINEFIVAKQVKDAYSTLLPRDLFPVYLLNLEIPSEKIDVNVHPRKLEVRFSDPQLVYRAVYQIISKTLDENDLVRQAVAPASASQQKRFVPVGDILKSKQIDIPIRFNSPEPRITGQLSDFQREMQKGEKSFFKDFQPAPDSGFKIISQVRNEYIIVETAQGIKIYDQHAASERVQYEKVKRQWQIGKLASQKKLISENIELAPAEARLVNDHAALFERLGFEIAGFGANTFKIEAVPVFLVNEKLSEIILNIIGNLEETVILDDQASEPIDKIFKMMACKSAIKFGDSLSIPSLEALINDLEELDNKYTCAHGRPCVVELTFDELMKMFKRK